MVKRPGKVSGKEVIDTIFKAIHQESINHPDEDNDNGISHRKTENNKKQLMERSVEPSFVSGQVKAPPSKSMTQRQLLPPSLQMDKARYQSSYCDDSLAALSIAVSLGARVDPEPEKVIISGCGELRERKLNCGNQVWQYACSHQLRHCLRRRLR